MPETVLPASDRASLWLRWLKYYPQTTGRLVLRKKTTDSCKSCLYSQLGQVAADVGLIGFQDASLIVYENLQELSQRGSEPDNIDWMHISFWLALASDYFFKGPSAESTREIVDYLASDKWPLPLDKSNKRIIAELLERDSVQTDIFKHRDTEEKIEITERIDRSYNEEEAGLIDTSDTLATAHTVNLELVEMLREEMESILRDVSESADELAQNGNSEIAGLQLNCSLSLKAGPWKLLRIYRSQATQNLSHLCCRF